MQVLKVNGCISIFTRRDKRPEKQVLSKKEKDRVGRGGGGEEWGSNMVPVAVRLGLQMNQLPGCAATAGRRACCTRAAQIHQQHTEAIVLFAWLGVCACLLQVADRISTHLEAMIAILFNFWDN